MILCMIIASVLFIGFVFLFMTASDGMINAILICCKEIEIENQKNLQAEMKLLVDSMKHEEDLKDKNILITTHGAALCGILNVIKDKPVSEYWGQGVHKNCAVTEVEVRDGAPVILSENYVYYKDEVKAW